MSPAEGQRRDAFPTEFVWGVATAAYQIEGAPAEDGKGRSIWDTFSQQPGRTTQGDTGDIACDDYHRVDEDIALVSRLNAGAYRFSISWPRIQPDSRGGANPAGLAHYSRLVDTLLERGITPKVTLYHWDLPQALQDKGGWAARDTAELFADYAGIVAGALGDRVHRWITINEPWVVANMGYRWGQHASGIRDERQAVATTHHLLRAHGRAAAAVRAAAPAGAGGPPGAGRTEVGITLNMAHVYVRPDDIPVTVMDWIVQPDGLYDLLIRLRDDAPGLPLHITENGAACDDYVNPDGTIEDIGRIDYLHGHLRAAHRALTAGADVRGYFAWSLMDNFEWAPGYSKRFGLMFVDYGTQRRIPKRSAAWFADVARTNSIPANSIPANSIPAD